MRTCAHVRARTYESLCLCVYLRIYERTGLVGFTQHLLPIANAGWTRMPRRPQDQQRLRYLAPLLVVDERPFACFWKKSPWRSLAEDAC